MSKVASLKLIFNQVGPSHIEGIELPDRESIIKNELNKVVPISEEISLVQVPTGDLLFLPFEIYNQITIF
jgi:hypothetical protein